MSTLEFNQLLLGNSAFLNPFAINLTRDNESAKDLVQETMYKAIANRERYINGTNIKAWLYTIMRNIFINDYRKKNKQRVIFNATPNEFSLDYNQSAISNLAESKLRLKEIQATVYYLPSIFKEPFQLYFDGYKYHEIAGQLGRSEGAVKQLQFRALENLRKRLNEK